MPLAVQDVDTLQQYISGVMDRADHHAGKVSAAVLALAGAVIWRKDAAPLQAMAQDGGLKNVLWVSIRGHRYAFSYNHPQQQIEMRAGTTHGAVLHTFDNSTPITDIEAIFRAL